MQGNTLKKIVPILFLLLAIPAYAQNTSQPGVIERAEVIEVISEEETSPLEDFANIETFVQVLSLKIIDGEDAGKEITLENDYVKFQKGDVIFLEKYIDNGVEAYTIKERDRQMPIYILLLIFALTILIFGGKQGLRSIISLVGGFLVIIYLLLPLLLKGYSPILISITFATIILFIAIFFTHGFNRESLVAFMGTILAVVLTGLLAFFSVSIMRLTGFESEESLFLSMGNAVKLNFHGLLLGGILIGVLGILDDIAVTQAAVVSEIYQSANTLTKKEVYKKAMRVGREHVSALVNTLVLAYAGASLPLLLLISKSDYPLRLITSQELFSVEIVRTIVGSIGLVLTVPITTLLAVYLLKDYKGKSALGHSHSAHTI